MDVRGVRMRRLGLLVVVLALGACVAGGVGKAPAKAENPITGGAVSTTALAPPPGAAAIPKPAQAPEKPAVAEPPKGEVRIAIPPASPEETACIKGGGSWSKVGKGGRSCVKATRDGGKSCTRGAQCEGLCLARSGTCAPVVPMFGCNDILQDDGRQVTLCID